MTAWREYPLAGTGGPAQIAIQTTTLPDRDLLVALPPGYAEASGRYPVVYLQDGQNLFDPATSFAGDWGLVETLNRHAAAGLEAIVVGIPNRGRKRRSEYSPFRDLLHGGGGGDRYLRMVVELIKPLVDRCFRTRPERAHTVIGGSSLGGSISLYALYRYAGIFGAASVQSPALWYARRALLRYITGRVRPPESRIYLDAGTAEGADMALLTRQLRDALVNAGYVEGRDLRYVEETGAPHHEAAWGRRFAEAMAFLLGS